ncbi:MAG: DNA recombination protein RmuC [Clostridiales bacterium]|nr:DNA recombination protein RmuC [Clostridiales bacterium]
MTDYLIIACLILNVITILLVLIKKNKSSDEKIQEMNIQLNVLKEKLESNGNQISGEISRLRIENAEHQKNMREETAKNLGEMTQKLDSMTEKNYKQQLEINKTVSESLKAINENNIEQNERQTKIVEGAIGKMQESNEKKLDQMRATVDEKLTSTLTERLNHSFKTVSEQLENVYKSLGEMKELSTGVTDNIGQLNRVLTNVKARGTWAEVQLEGILDQTIPKMYDKNVATVEGSRELVEFAVKIPSSDGSSFAYLPIDSKFPMEDYVRLCEAADSGNADEVQKCRKALEDRVKNEAKEVKKYINEPKTTPFAILYLATEGLYAEIASSRSGLPEKLLEDNIMIAGPTTITALLNSLSVGFKAVTINEKAKEVREVLSATKAQYDKFGIMLEKAKKKIDEAGKTLDDAQKRNSIIQKKLRSFDSMEQGESEEVLGLELSEETEN